MKIAIVIAFVCAIMLPLTASADIYRWVNERGVVSFTDNLGNVPAKYRAKAVLIDANVPAVQEVIIGQVGEGKDKAGDVDKDGKKDGADTKQKKLFGGKDEATWKKESDRMNFEISDTEKQLSEMRDRLSDTSKMSRTEYLSLQNSIKLLDQRLNTQKNQRDNFLDTARKAGAPL